MRRPGKRSTAEQVCAGIELDGINALVTGANTGLGKETTRVLARGGAHITMACRDMDRAREAREDLLRDVAIDPGQLELLALDLNSLAATRAAADEYCARGEPLHLLVNNAGIMIPMERRTEDGFEAHLGINHLGHFLFTNLLEEPLHAAGQARVVVLSSAAMSMATLDRKFDDINWERRKFRGFPSYGDSKLMNLLFAEELNRRWSAQGVVANALHPGIIGTELARDQSPMFMLLGIAMLPFMKDIPRGAATSVYVATAPEYAERGGLFFSNCREARPMHRLAGDEDMAAQLWRLSEDMTGL